jgi:hypothetical protein
MQLENFICSGTCLQNVIEKNQKIFFDVKLNAEERMVQCRNKYLPEFYKITPGATDQLEPLQKLTILGADCNDKELAALRVFCEDCWERQKSLPVLRRNHVLGEDNAAKSLPLSLLAERCYPFVIGVEIPNEIPYRPWTNLFPFLKFDLVKQMNVYRELNNCNTPHDIPQCHLIRCHNTIPALDYLPFYCYMSGFHHYYCVYRHAGSLDALKEKINKGTQGKWRNTGYTRCFIAATEDKKSLLVYFLFRVPCTERSFKLIGDCIREKWTSSEIETIKKENGLQSDYKMLNGLMGSVGTMAPFSDVLVDHPVHKNERVIRINATENKDVLVLHHNPEMKEQQWHLFSVHIKCSRTSPMPFLVTSNEDPSIAIKKIVTENCRHPQYTGYCKECEVVPLPFTGDGLLLYGDKVSKHEEFVF